MGSSSNAPKSSSKHQPLTYSISAAPLTGASGRSLSNREHRRLDRSVSEPVVQQIQQQPKPAATTSNSSRYKTELCRPFEENGLCKYGDKCQFAHGINELRNLARHPKYKTELCRTYHSSGFCPYGPRCHFIHNDFNRNPINGLPQSGNLILQQPGGIALQQSGNIVLQQPGNNLLQQPGNNLLQQPGNNLLQQPGNILQQPGNLLSQTGNNRLQQSGNINIPVSSSVDSFLDCLRGLPIVDVSFKNFSPGSAGDLSPNSSSISGSPTSCNGFPMENDDCVFSPMLPHTAPPVIGNKNAFFGQDFIPFAAMSASRQQQSQSFVQRLMACNSQSNMSPSIENLDAAVGELTLGPKRNSNLSATSSKPASLNDNSSKLRLPIFNKLSFSPIIYNNNNGPC